jgi:hypothetical protein
MDKKYIFFGLGLVVLLLGSAFIANEQVVQPMLDSRTVEEVVGVPIVAQEYDFGFKYPSGVEGYAMIEPPVATSSVSLKKAYLMFEYGQYVEYQNSTGTLQTPPTVSVFIFDLPDKAETATGSRSERLMQWVNENPQYTSFNRMVGDMTEVEIDGVPALKYSTEGIYKQDFHILSYSGNAYILAAQYEGEDDPNLSMYENLINSVTFY